MHGPTPLDRARDRLTREVLEDLYLERGLTSTDIGVVLGVDPGRVIEALHRHGIPVRTRGMRSTGGRPPLTKELLEELYVRQGLSLEAIAAKLGYTRAGCAWPGTATASRQGGTGAEASTSRGRGSPGRCSRTSTSDADSPWKKSAPRWA